MESEMDVSRVDPEQALVDELNKKYANRVLHDIGLCVCVFDLAEASEGKVRYGDGFLWYTGAHTEWLLRLRLTALKPARKQSPFD